VGARVPADDVSMMVLLNPGPVNVSERVRHALLKPDICHRESECRELLQGIRAKLLRAFAPSHEEEYVALLLAGSGTAAVEAMVTSSLAPGRSLLIVNNGVYARRMAAMAAAANMPTMDVPGPDNQRLDLTPIAEALRDHSAVQAVAVAHHETSTGLLNPIRELGEMAAATGRFLMVDGVSSLAGETIDLRACHVGMIAGSSGKCIQGFPGLGFVLVRRDLMEQMAAYEPRSVYFHLPTYYREQVSGSVPFTPAVQLAYALDEALSELLDEGVANRVARYRRMAQIVRDGMKALGVSCYLREHPSLIGSNTLTAFLLPDRIQYERLHDLLRERGYIIYAGQSRLAQTIFRIANIGALTETTMKDFLAAFASVLPEARKTEARHA